MTAAASIAVSQIAAGNTSLALAYGLAASGKANVVGGTGTDPDDKLNRDATIANCLLAVVFACGIIFGIVKHFS